jgi:hypothetical protein
MNSPGSGSSLEKLARDEEDDLMEKRPSVDESTVLRAENGDLQKMVRKLHNDLEAAHAQNRRDREALADLQTFAAEARHNADPAVLEELKLAREDLAQEKESRRQLEESLEAAQTEFNAKREALERDIEELKIAKRHLTEENAAAFAKFDEEAARRDEEVASLRNKLTLSADDTKHFQAMVEETEKKLGTSRPQSCSSKK